MPKILPAGRPLVLTALVLLVALPVAAQEPAVVTPGSDLLDLSHIAPGTAAYTVTLVQGQSRQPIGDVVRTVSIDDEAGEATFVLETTMMGNKFADTTVVAWPSLAARRHRSENPQRRLHYDVADGHLIGEMAPASGEAEAFDLTVDGPIYDFSVIGTLAAALPLAEGYVVTIPAYTYEAGGLADYTVRVVGSEKLAREGKAPADVWVVEPSRPGEDQTVQYYFTKQGHDLIRIRVVPQPGLEVLVDAK